MQYSVVKHSMFSQLSIHSACQVLSYSKKGVLNVQGQNTFINVSYLHLRLPRLFPSFFPMLKMLHMMALHQSYTSNCNNKISTVFPV